MPWQTTVNDADMAPGPLAKQYNFCQLVTKPAYFDLSQQPLI
jgi:hypothetical protein